jgi:GNAT superfamily N-acetyltransferase
VREDFQGMGIGSHFLGILEGIARENGYRGFVATVLLENRSMIRVFQKRYPDARIEAREGSANIVMDFADAAAGPDDTAEGNADGGAG